MELEKSVQCKIRLIVFLVLVIAPMVQLLSMEGLGSESSEKQAIGRLPYAGVTSSHILGLRSGLNPVWFQDPKFAAIQQKIKDRSIQEELVVRRSSATIGFSGALKPESKINTSQLITPSVKKQTQQNTICGILKSDTNNNAHGTKKSVRFEDQQSTESSFWLFIKKVMNQVFS